jgi:hypothetical protein
MAEGGEKLLARGCTGCFVWCKGVHVRPALEARGRYLCCPVCGGSYGEVEEGAPQTIEAFVRSGAPTVVDQQRQDAQDAARWRGVKARHGMCLVRLATGSTGYSSAKKDGILDAWADMAVAEVDAFDPEAHREDVRARIQELESVRGLRRTGLAGGKGG